MQKYRGVFVIMLLVAIGLAACSAEPETAALDAATSAQGITITAELFYRERIALPPGAVAVAEVENASTGTVVAEARDALAGRQVPVAVSLELDRSRLPQDADLVFRGSVEVDGLRRWQSEAQSVDLTGEDVDIGRMLLRAVAERDTVDGSWVVEDILGGGIIDDSRVTLEFSGGRLSGRATCNTYTGSWSLEDGRLSIGETAVTMMACPEALMNQERRFLDALASADGFHLDETGALILTSTGENVIRARRER